MTCVRRLGALLVSLLLWGGLVGPVLAVQLNELRPAAVKDFVQADRVTVVLFTSPDENCGYCVGQLAAFNAAALHYRGEPPVFAFVQWRPWRAFPAMDLPRPLLAIPHVKVFRKGEVLGELDGKLSDPSRLTTLVDDALAGRLAALPTDRPATGAPALELESAALTDADRVAVVAHVREQLLGRAASVCMKLFPDQSSAFERALATWATRHGDAARRGQVLVLQQSSAAQVKATIDPIGREQRRQLEQALPMPSNLSAGDCERAHRFIAQDRASPSAR